MTRAKFERLVVEAIMLIPKRFQREMQQPCAGGRRGAQRGTPRGDEIDPPDSLYGLYQANCRCRNAPGEHGNALPDCITLFQRPIEADHEAEDEIRAAIGETLIHEVGRLLRAQLKWQIQEIEERYWRGDTLGADQDDK